MAKSTVRKLINVIGCAMAVLMIVSGWIAMSTSTFIRDNPRFPDYGKGYTIPLAIRGYGMRYINQMQWDAIALCWDLFYLFLGLFFFVFVTRVAAEGYWGFMEGWRSNDK